MRSFSEVLRQQAHAHPHAEAFRFLPQGGAAPSVLSRAALLAQAGQVAALLGEHGAAGRPVLLVYPAGLDFVVALFGCLLAGAIAVPVPVLTPQRAFERAPAIARDSGAALGLTLAGLADATLRGVTWLATDRIADRAVTLPPVGADAVALLQYTSGTTAAPRGVVLTQGNLLHNLAAQSLAVRPRVEDRAVSWLPMYHDMGLLGFMLFPVFAGIPCALMSPLTFLQRPLRWPRAISDYRGTISAAPSFAYDLCARRATAADCAALDLSGWRIAVCGGEVVRPDALDRFAAAFAPAGFAAAALAPAYGLAEMSLLACSVGDGAGLDVCGVDAPALAAGRVAPAEDPQRQRRLAACGRPWPGTDLAIVDPARRLALPAGEVGEIWLRGGSVAQGYWRRPAETAETFGARLADDPTQRSWLRTGDLGAMSPRGLVVTGRRKDLIIVRGVNYDPLDIELAASVSHPALSAGAAGAFALAAADGAETVVLAQEVERAAIGSLDPATATTAVATALSRRLGLTLHDLVLVRPGTLPRTTSGKVQRHRCREQYLAGTLARLSETAHPALGRFRPASPC